MVIATFNSATGWAGKTITHDDGVFTLEGHGAISAVDVLTYDRQGHISWAYEGLREWCRGLPHRAPCRSPSSADWSCAASESRQPASKLREVTRRATSWWASSLPW